MESINTAVICQWGIILQLCKITWEGFMVIVILGLSEGFEATLLQFTGFFHEG